MNYVGSKDARKQLARTFISSPVSHCFPVNPVVQLQLYPLTKSVQVPMFLQGLLSQSSISVLRLLKIMLNEQRFYIAMFKKALILCYSSKNGHSLLFNLLAC